ncbi:hypothetical protein VPH35_019024 [Triticum aestivum]
MDSVSIFCFFSYAICGHPKIFSTEIRVPFGSNANLACMSNFRSDTNNQEKGRRQGASSPERIYGTFHGSHNRRGEFYANPTASSVMRRNKIFTMEERLKMTPPTWPLPPPPLPPPPPLDGMMTPGGAKNSEDDTTRKKVVTDIGAGDDSFVR